MTYPPQAPGGPMYAPPQGYRPYGPPQGYPMPPQAPSGPWQGPPPQGAPQGPPQGPPGGYGYAPVAPKPPVQHSSHTKIIAILTVALLVAVGAFVLISKFVTPGPDHTKVCNPTCHEPPPVGPPVTASPRFTAADGSFSVEYPTDIPVLGPVVIKKGSDVVVAELAHNVGVIRVQGGPAKGATAQQAVASFVQGLFPDARAAYEISNAQVGYTPGFGAVYDVYLQTTSGSSTHERLVALGAVKNDTYVVVVGLGQYQEWAKDGISDGHPSGVGNAVAMFMDPINNSVLWKGDTPR